MTDFGWETGFAIVAAIALAALLARQFLDVIARSRRNNGDDR